MVRPRFTKGCSSFFVCFLADEVRIERRMSRGTEYRKLLVSIGKVSLARKMRKPYPWALFDTLILSSLAAVVLAVFLFVLASHYAETAGGFVQSQERQGDGHRQEPPKPTTRSGVAHGGGSVLD
jgi:hypothetical protein